MARIPAAFPPLIGPVSQCVDGPVIEDLHEITGSHYARCEQHHHEHTLWARARNAHVGRVKRKSLADDLPFDKDAVRADREAEIPYVPKPLSDRSDRARGRLPLTRAEVSRLRRTVADLLLAKTPLDKAARNGHVPTAPEMDELLTAIEAHTSYVHELLKTAGA